jgi:hypothetical protein
MALPTQEIEKLAKAPTEEQGTYKQLLMLAGTLLFISGVLYLGLTFGYAPYIENQIVSVEQQSKALDEKVPKEKQDQLIAFYSQISNLSTLLGKHPNTIKIFGWLEANTQPNIYFSKLSFNLATYQLSLIGVGKTPLDIAEQINIFEKASEVSRVNFNNISSMTGGNWQFNASIFLDPKFIAAAGTTVAGSIPVPNPVSVTSTATSSNPLGIPGTQAPALSTSAATTTQGQANQPTSR